LSEPGSVQADYEEWAIMGLDKAKRAAIQGLQDANMTLCDVYFLLDEHTSPAFNEEMTAAQEKIRELMGAVELIKQ
jgi:hypothetical protein